MWRGARPDPIAGQAQRNRVNTEDAAPAAHMGGMWTATASRTPRNPNRTRGDQPT